MRALKYIFVSVCMWAIAMSCDTKQDWWDSGIASPYFDGTMMEYLRSDDFNWALTVQVIERAGLTDLFEGKVDSLSEITFLGPTSYSIERYLLDSQHKSYSTAVYKSVQDIPVDSCRNIILRHVIKGKHLKDEMAYRNKDYYIYEPQQDGGTDFFCVGGNRVRFYLERMPYKDIPDVGAVEMGLYSLTKGKEVPVASPDIQPRNGVVHSLNYGYEFGKI